MFLAKKFDSDLGCPLAIARTIGPVLVATLWDYFGNPHAAVMAIVLLASLGAMNLMGAYRAAGR